MIIIKEPYYSAGHKYGWTGSPTGVGINLIKLRGEGRIDIKLAKSEIVYSIEKQKARTLIEKYNSYHEVKGVVLGVIPIGEFRSSEKTENKDKLSLFDNV